jgi:hypothetical protein
VAIKITRVGFDIAKQVFQVHGVDEHGMAKVRKTLTRRKVLEFFAQLPPCLIGMEACGGAHYWGRELTKFGHTVKLMAAQFVIPYRKHGKNDANDAEAICEAVGRPNIEAGCIDCSPILIPEAKTPLATQGESIYWFLDHRRLTPVVTLRQPSAPAPCTHDPLGAVRPFGVSCARRGRDGPEFSSKPVLLGIGQ